MRRARVVLKMPQEQKRAMVSAASFGVRRFSFTKLIIFWAKLIDSMPWPHMVDSMIACLPGVLSPTFSKPSEYATEWRGMPAFLQAFLAFSIDDEMLTDRPRSS